jgi:hypothetical protein
MQNTSNRYWSSQNPQLSHEYVLHPVKVYVWCAVSARKTFGTVFFHETFNCEIYVQVVLGQIFLELTEENKLYGWFQLNLATAHTASMSMQALSSVFGDRIISSGIWPAYLPDLNPCDFFLLGPFEEQILQHKPELKKSKKIFLGNLQIFMENNFRG